MIQYHNSIRVLINGGTGRWSGGDACAPAEPPCAEVVMVNRGAISLTADPCVRQVISDTADAQFPAEVTKLASIMIAQGALVWARAAMAAAGTREPSRVASRPSGFDPSRRNSVSLAGGTRSRASPSLHIDVAVTVPRSGALLTGLATAVGAASRRGPRVGAMLTLLRLPFSSGHCLHRQIPLLARAKGCCPSRAPG
jgi:hypothetical protein